MGAGAKYPFCVDSVLCQSFCDEQDRQECWPRGDTHSDKMLVALARSLPRIIKGFRLTVSVLEIRPLSLRMAPVHQELKELAG